VRDQIFALQKEQKELGKEFLSKLKNEHGIDLRFRNFVVLAQKPEYPKNYFTLISRLEEIKAVEKQIEQEILHKISGLINEKIPELENTINELTKVDRMLAKARLVNKFNLTQPDIREERIDMEIVEGRHLPLQETCKFNKRDYQPLTV